MENTIYDERNHKLKEVNKKIQKALGGELRRPGKKCQELPNSVRMQEPPRSALCKRLASS